MKGLICHRKDFLFYPKDNREGIDGFETRIRFEFQKITIICVVNRLN